MNITRGTRVRSTVHWNKDYQNEGEVVSVNGDDFTVLWPEGLYHNNGKSFYQEPGEADTWDICHTQEPNALLEVVEFAPESMDAILVAFDHENVRVSVKQHTVTVVVNETIVVINR